MVIPNIQLFYSIHILMSRKALDRLSYIYLEQLEMWIPAVRYIKLHQSLKMPNKNLIRNLKTFYFEQYLFSWKKADNSFNPTKIPRWSQPRSHSAEHFTFHTH